MVTETKDLGTDDNVMTINLRENTGSVSENLRKRPIGEEHAVPVPFEDVANVRGLITQMHKNNTGVNAGIKFKTAKTATGIKVWRES